MTTCAPRSRSAWASTRRLLDGFEVRDGAHGAVPFLGGVELDVRFFDNAG
jgi:hypothetical protein